MSQAVGAIIAAVITGALALVGVLLANAGQSKRITAEFEKNSALADMRVRADVEKYSAVTDAKLEELTREVREHNEFAKRIPVIEEQIKVANHRIEDLERTAS